MAVRKPSNLRLGVFVVAASVLILVAVAWLGAGRFWRARETLETYFNESVQGLEVGSPVKYRGVVVGRVSRITFTGPVYESDKPVRNQHPYVMVEADMRPTLVDSPMTFKEAGGNEFLASMAQEGLRVRLASQGLTGTSYLEIDYVDATRNPPLEIAWEPRHLYIPSARSTQTQILSAAGEAIGKLRAIDFAGTVTHLDQVLVTLADRLDKLDTAGFSERGNRVLDKLEKKIDEAPVSKLAGDVSKLVGELRDTNRALQQVAADPALRKLPQDLGATASKLRELTESGTLERTLGKLEKTMTRLEKVTGTSEGDMEQTLANLRATTQNLKELTADLKKHPSRLIWGR
jgi:ABC-type transporter Mla subunit MlaD